MQDEGWLPMLLRAITFFIVPPPQIAAKNDADNA
jgi:hypothetical protein